MKWKTVSENLMSMSSSLSEYSSRYNEQTIEAFSMFQDAVTKLIRSQIKLHIHYYYVTLGTEIHPNTQQQAEELKGIVKRYYPSATVDVSFIGADLLMEMYNTDSEIRINLVLAEQPISLSNKDYVALVNLGTYYKFITDDSSNLRKSFFEANVRDYQGKNSVNSSIADTLEHRSTEDFWWLNNGVTILASEITLITNKSLQLVNPEIVNGLQTSREIFNFFSENPYAVENENRTLLVRIIMPESEEARDNIIFATNNQTNIDYSDYIKFIFEPDKFDYSKVDTADIMWCDFFNIEEYRNILLKHKSDYWNADKERRIELGFGSSFEHRVVYKYLFR